jgi:septum site-determining protein MinD
MGNCTKKGVSTLGKAITVASGKGGTGKTSFCANVAVALCAMGEKVLLIDADAGLRSLDLALGMSDQLLFTYGDVIEGRASLKEAAAAHPKIPSLRVLTAPASPELPYTQEQITHLLRYAKQHFSFVLVDCAAGLGHDILWFAAASDSAIVVSTPDQASLRGAQVIAQALMSAGQRKALIAVNRLRPGLINKGDAATVDRAMDASGLSLLGAVPEDEAVIVAGNRGEILPLYCYSPAAQAYINIAKRLRGNRIPLLDQVPGKYDK